MNDYLDAYAWVTKLSFPTGQMTNSSFASVPIFNKTVETGSIEGSGTFNNNSIKEIVTFNIYFRLFKNECVSNFSTTYLFSYKKT